MIKKFFTTFFLFVFIAIPFSSFADEKDVSTKTSSGIARIIDIVENFRKEMRDRLQTQKESFDKKSNIGEVVQEVDLENLDTEEQITNYVTKGSSDKMIEPIYKVLSFVFYGLVLIFSKATIFYLVLFFFLFVLLRYLWRRAV